MRILFITNFYPPVSRGGYELWCQEVADNLREKNNEVLILTSRFCCDQIELKEPEWIHRTLYLEMDFKAFRNSLGFFTTRKKNQKKNLLALSQIIEQFKPDFILIWGMWNLDYALAESAEKLLPDRVAYYFGDYWPVRPHQIENYWKLPAKNWATYLPKMLLKTIALKILAHEKTPQLKYQYAIYPTEFMGTELTKRGLSPVNSRVIYGGIETGLFKIRVNKADKEADEITTLLFVGRLTNEKGVHTAIEAVARLIHFYQHDAVRLNIVGSGDPDYVTYLHQLVKNNGLESIINFLGDREKKALPEIYTQSDILLFTSIWPEPFGRVIVEAMASGVPVVATATGGAAEILQNNENSLIFKPGDADKLADLIYLLICNPGLRRKLANCGRKYVLENFDISKMAEGIENYLESISATR